MFGATGTQTAPRSTQMTVRIDAAQAAITRATEAIPQLRAEDARLEEEITRLIGAQIAEGGSPSTRISELRARRSEIAAEIEGLAAASRVAATGIAEAKRVALAERRRETRAEANEVRRRIVDAIDRAEKMLQELWELDAELSNAADDEQRLWRAEMQLNDQLGVASDSPTPPSSNAPSSGTTLIDPAVRAIASFDRTRVDDFHRALDRMRRVRQAAAAARDLPLP